MMNMKIVTKVKGKDDFGREKISGNVWKYSHHYPRVSKGDYILYYLLVFKFIYITHS